MDGPGILARSLTRARVKDSYGNLWQYHSRSDNHSKIACWALLFDLLQHCPLLVEQVRDGKVGFGINHPMRDFRTNREKFLDLVLCTPGTGSAVRKQTFAQLAEAYSIDLMANEAAKLQQFPSLPCVAVGSVHAAIEAKACMTEHIKALPRLFDELNSSQVAIHGSADFAIAVGFAVVNIASSFISSDRNKRESAQAAPVITKHTQPNAATATVAKLRALPRRTQQGAEGFDAFGIVLLDMKNDFSAVTVSKTPPAPQPQDSDHYDQMVRRIASLYGTKFSSA